MSLDRPTSWNDGGLDWDNIDPSDTRYWEAIVEAVQERHLRDVWWAALDNEFMRDWRHESLTYKKLQILLRGVYSAYVNNDVSGGLGPLRFHGYCRTDMDESNFQVGGNAYNFAFTNADAPRARFSAISTGVNSVADTIDSDKSYYHYYDDGGFRRPNPQAIISAQDENVAKLLRWCYDALNALVWQYEHVHTSFYGAPIRRGFGDQLKWAGGKTWASAVANFNAAPWEEVTGTGFVVTQWLQGGYYQTWWDYNDEALLATMRQIDSFFYRRDMCHYSAYRSADPPVYEHPTEDTVMEPWYFIVRKRISFNFDTTSFIPQDIQHDIEVRMQLVRPAILPQEVDAEDSFVYEDNDFHVPHLGWAICQSPSGITNNSSKLIFTPNVDMDVATVSAPPEPGINDPLVSVTYSRRGYMLRVTTDWGPFGRIAGYGLWLLRKFDVLDGFRFVAPDEESD